MAENWFQITKWFWTHIKGIRVQIEIIAAIFKWFSKQQVNLSLLVSGWYLEKWRLTNLPDQDWKLTSDGNLILSSYERSQSANRDYCSHFWLISQAKSKFAIACVRLMLGKVRLDWFTGPRRKTDVRYRFGFKVILKNLGRK